MEPMISVLSGALVGGVITAFGMLLLLRKQADRDLIERRVRACADYRETLGDIARVLAHQGDQPAVLEQAWKNVSLFCREYRLTSWFQDPALRGQLGELVEELEQAAAAYGRQPDGAGGRAAQVLCEKHRQLDRLLGRELSRQQRAFLGSRFGSSSANGNSDATAD